MWIYCLFIIREQFISFFVIGISALICGVKYEKHIYRFIVESSVLCTTYKTGTKASIHDIKIQRQ